MSETKYTLNDWLEGQIPLPKEIKDNPDKDILVYWTYECYKPRISESEFEKIRALQKEIFFELIDLKVEALKRKFFYDLHFIISNQTERKDIYHLEFQSLKKKLDDPYLLKRMKLRKWDRKVVTQEVYRAYINYKRDLKNSSREKEFSISTESMMKKAARNKDFRRFSEIELKGLFGTYVYHRYLTSLKKEYVSEFGNDSELPKIEDGLLQEELIKYSSKKVRIDKLIKIFAWEKFDPKTHSKQMIEDYLKGWEQNQGASYPRKTTVVELKKDYPKLAKIYDKSSGGVIKNWEDKWKKFREARTEN